MPEIKEESMPRSPDLTDDELTALPDIKRKASEDPPSPSASKRIKHVKHIKHIKHDASTEPQGAKKLALKPIPFPEKVRLNFPCSRADVLLTLDLCPCVQPAVIEERNGEIEFRVVNNDGDRESLIILTGLKCIFQKQLPKMPKDYIARLVYDRTHLSIAIVKKPLEVVGGITYRPFKGRRFAEIVFCAISSDQQVKGYGAHLMSHLKDYVKASSDVMHFLTYADNYAIGYFKKQGFTKEITLDRKVWMGYIKDYEGGTIMQCSMLPRIRYLEMGRMLLKQKECVQAKIRAYSKSHIVHAPPKEWKNGVKEINPLDIPAIRASGWSPDMDELARQPRHGPNYNQLLHLLNDLQNHNSAWPFLVPVNRDDVADYYDVIKEPMDLSTMENKLEADQYATPEDFVRDAKLIFGNCRKYNNENTPYAKSANKLEKFMWQQIKAVPEWSHLEPEK
ncbi:histone acetyltransferase GCN5 [Ophiocordyceps sinensis CO18]|uniref:histone acetyltransferase n=1 Tax=Ophiocordyceps sinensis (strain Co18 / CGMCC 3.14243) TaxID=911162 RepID=T5ANV2_OPHSC|nr:histone acetyltransferase GCN5 [Ophiocordyceps sinensis CO18]